jgi:type IX secretion system PorP/SprF family membrane protein
LTNLIRILIFISISFYSGFGYTQDPLSSHFFMNLGNLNPSLAGSADQQRFFANYRNQYPGLHSAYVTYNAGFDIPISVLQGGIGANISNDVMANGLFNTVAGDFFYSYHLQVSHELFFMGGLQFSMMNKNLRSQLINNQDVQDVIPSRSTYMLDVSVGFSAYWKGLVSGIALHHLDNTVLNGNEAVAIPYKITVHASYYIPRGYSSIRPSLIVQKQANLFQTTYGGMYMYRTFGAGLWMRQDERFRFSALIFAMRYDFSAFSIIYSYDLSLNNSTYWLNFGSHEVTFLMKIKYKDVRKKKPRAIKCPTF